MAQTFGPFNVSRDMFLNFFAYIQGNCTFVTRDIFYSEKYLKMFGIQNFCNSCDDLFFLHESLNDVDDKPEVEGKYVLLEFFMHTNDIESHVPVIKEIQDFVKEYFDAKLVFVPLDKDFGGSIQGGILKKWIPEIVVYDVFNETSFLPIKKMENIVKNSQFVICQRYHLLLTALRNSVPCMQMLKDVCGNKQYYFNKAYGLLSYMFGNKIKEEYFLLESFASFKLKMNDMNEILDYQKQMFAEMQKTKDEKIKKRNELIKDLINL